MVICLSGYFENIPSGSFFSEAVYARPVGGEWTLELSRQYNPIDQYLDNMRSEECKDEDITKFVGIFYISCTVQESEFRDTLCSDSTYGGCVLPDELVSDALMYCVRNMKNGVIGTGPPLDKHKSTNPLLNMTLYKYLRSVRK